MANDILQRFLAKRLFDVGADDNRLELLRQAAAELGAKLKASPQRISAFTMVAIDPDVAPDEPILGEVGAILQSHWNSYKGAFADAVLPVVFRGIILTALEQIIGSEPVATAVTLTCRNLLPKLAAPSDKDLWASLIDSSSHKLELRARREWALPSTAVMRETELKLPNTKPVSPPNFPTGWLTKQLEAASGPHNKENEATDGNPHFPNAGEAWAHEFSPRVAAAIAGSTNSVVKKLIENIQSENGFAAQTEAISTFVQTMAAGIAQTSLGLERRTSLIWWKEALYSSSAERSYRDLTLPIAAALVAIDGAEQTGAFAPRMAEALLLETIRAIDPKAINTVLPLADLCLGAVAPMEEGASVVLKHFSTLHREPGRTPLASLIGSGESIDSTILMRRIGLSADIKLSPADFALWLFRDLQASAATPAKAKRKAK